MVTLSCARFFFIDKYLVCGVRNAIFGESGENGEKPSPTEITAGGGPP